MKLTLQDFRELYGALNEAFPDVAGLALATRLGMDEVLGRMVNVAQATSAVVLDLIRQCEGRDQITQLITGARLANPTNERLRAFAQTFQLPTAVRTREAIQQPHAKFRYIDQWIRQAAQIMRAVVRVDAGGPPGQTGTGFLVGSEAVLTNWHVMAMLGPRDQPQPAVTERDRVTFDHFRSLDDAQPMPEVLAPLANPWLVASSDENALDFALVRIVPPADGPVRRQPLSPGARLPNEGEPIVVFQHPGGDWMKWSFGNLTQIDRANGTFHHNANTVGGSSGAPVFTADLELVGLHWGSQGNNGGSLIASVVANLPDRRFPQ